MSDLAVLGVSLDTSRVKPGIVDINAIVPAARGAQTAVNALQTAAKPASEALEAMGKASSHASSAHAGMSGQAQSAMHSVRSLFDSIIAGASPTQALILQFGHLSYAASGQGGLKGAFGELANNFGKLINPANLLAGAFAGVAIGFEVALSKVAASEVAFSNLADRVGVTVTALHALESAAAIKGINSSDFTKGIEQLAKQSYEAQHNVGALNEYFKATNTSVGTFEQNFSRVVDLIKNAGNDQARINFLQQLGLPATSQWLELMRQGGASLDAAKASAVALGGEFDQQLVQRWKDLHENMNSGWDDFEKLGKRAIINVAGWMSTLEKKGDLLGAALRSMVFGADVNNTPLPSADPRKGASGSGPLKVNITPDLGLQKQQLSQDIQRISTLGNLATVEDLVRQKQLELNLAGLNNVGVTGRQQAAIIDYTRNLNLGVIAIREQVAQQQILTQQFGMSIGEAAAYAAVQEKINAARIKGAPLTDDEIARLKAEAEALGKVVQLNSNLSELKSTSQDALSGFVKDLVAGKSAAEALHSVIGKLENKLVDMATSAVINKLFAQLTGVGLGGTPTPIASGTSVGAPTQHTGGIVGSESGPSRTLPMSVFAGAPRFHGGGMANDEVPAVLQKGEAVFTPGQLRGMAPVGSGGRDVHVTVINNADNTSVQTNKRSQGNVDFHEIIVSTIGKELARGGYDQALRARTGTIQQPRGR